MLRRAFKVNRVKTGEASSFDEFLLADISLGS